MDAKERFVSLARQHHCQIVGTNQLHGFRNNWDIEIRYADGTSFKVDVKSSKKISRSDNIVQNEWQWIELHGNDEHDLGWLFDTESDLIAFELSDSFIIIERLRLQNLIDEKVDKSIVVTAPTEAKYKIYSRPGKLEAITLVETSHLGNIAKEIWYFPT